MNLKGMQLNVNIFIPDQLICRHTATFSDVNHGVFTLRVVLS